MLIRRSFSMEINPVKGTHDIYLEEADIYHDIEKCFSEVAMLYNYHEIRTPIIEHTNLFARSAGEDSDIVNKEMYTFLDKGGRSITLRPEMTAGVLRSIVSNKLYIAKEMPVRFFYSGPCFRYERPQAGRYRQFHQFGIETLGVNTPYNDVEVILMAKQMLSMIRLDNVTVKINSLGNEETRKNYRAALREYFGGHIENMCEDCKRRYELNPLRILDCKVPTDRPIIEKAPVITDFLTPEDKEWLNTVRDMLSDLGIETVLDTHLVRGLDYYTGVVFEIASNYKEAPDFGALGGGGHYAHLLKELGGPDLEGAGFSFGLERVASLCQIIFKEEIEKYQESLDFYVVGLNDENIQSNFKLITSLRLEGFISDMNYEVKSMKSIFKYASKIGSKFVIIAGDDEMNKGIVRVKNMLTEEQYDVPYDDQLFAKLHDLMKEYYEKRFNDNSEVEEESGDIN